MIEQAREASCTTCGRPVVWITTNVGTPRATRNLRHARYPRQGIGVDGDCDLPLRDEPLQA